MGKRNAAAAIVDADRLQPFESPPKRMKHGPTAIASPPTGADPPASEPYSPNVSVSEFTLSKEFVDGTKLMDLTLKQWRIGKPIGKGSFGEIFLASDDIDTPVTSENAKYVVKIEPHSNGPLFVEIHCLLNTAKRTDTCIIPPGMPEYIASGSHIFKNERYRFLILKRYQRDLHSMIKNKRVNPSSIPVIACQILDVLEHLHDQGYVHSDIKAENLMIGKVEAGGRFVIRLSNCQQPNGHDNHHLSNGVASEGKVGRGRGKKASGDVPMVNGSAAPPGNGLYYHQEQEMCTRTRNLRPLKTVTYRDLSDEDDRSGGARLKGGASGSLPKRRGRKRNNDASFSCSISPRRSGYEELKAATEIAHRNELKRSSLPKAEAKAPEEERIHLIDFGLASKFVDSTGQHRPFCMDQRRAHDGTLEFTSRDAHMGAHARRSDLECLGYNLVYWSRGFLPWKDEKLLNQPEQVHRMKEYFMTDVREMLRLIYGDDCPAYLGDFLAYVGSLTYDERPDYQYCKSLFYKELKRLGSPVSRTQPLRLDVGAIVQLSEPLTAQDEAEITNKINHVKSLMKLGALIPYRESMLHSKTTSPKNLRSKRGDANGRNAVAQAAAATVTDGAAVATPPNGASNAAATVASTRQKEKHFSCEEIFATDADQIARERVEKEFERAEQMEETVIRYTGRPTYAIQELLERKSRGHSLGSGLEYTECEGYIKGYTKPMMDILRKRQSQLFRQIQESNSAGKNNRKENHAPMEQENEPEEDEKEEPDEEEQEEEEAVKAGQENELEEDDDEANVKMSKYEQDDDYAAEEDDEEEDSVEDDVEDEEEEEVASEGEEEEEFVGEEEDEEEEDDEEDEEEEEGVEEEIQEAVIVIRNNGYESRGSYRRKKECKSRKKEDTDSDFINDGGCEEEGAETDACNLPDDDEEEVEEEEEDDQQDSDFNDQESTATESDVIVPVKRRVGRPRKNPLPADSESGGTTIRKEPAKRGRPRKVDSSNVESSAPARRIHDNDEEDEVSDCSRKDGRKQRSGHRRKQHREPQRQVLVEDGDGDNARLFGADHRDEVDGREAVRKQTHHPYNNNNHCNSKAYYGDVDDSSHDMAPPRADGANASKYRFVKRRKSGLRERIRPTDRGHDYADNMERKRKASLKNKQRRESAANHGGDSEAPAALEDDYSCSSSSSTSRQSDSSSCASARSSRSRALSHSSSAASLASSSIVTAPKRRGRKRKQPPPIVSSRDSSGTRQSSVRSRKQQAEAPTDNENSNNRSWGGSNSNSSQSAATSRSSSVSASLNGASGGSECGATVQLHHGQLATLPEHPDDFLEDDDGDDTRDVDYSPVCTRRRRKAGTAEAGGNGAVSRKNGSTTIRRKHDTKGLVGKGIGTAAPHPPAPPPPSSSSSSSAVNGGGSALPPAYGQSSSISRRLDNVIQPPPPVPVAAAAALIQHHHHQQQRGRRPQQHHMAYQNYYRVNDQHHLPSTMLVRTYSRG